MKLELWNEDYFICCKCQKILRKIKKFKDKVQKAQDVIFHFSSLQAVNVPLPKLATIEGTELQDAACTVHLEVEKTEISADSISDSENVHEDANLSLEALPQEKTKEPTKGLTEVVQPSATPVETKEVVPYTLDRNKLVCKVCSIQFVFYKELVNHMPVHYPSFVCDICGKICATKISFKSHLKVHDTPRHSCPECKKSYKKAFTLKNHIKVAHMGEKLVYKCSECPETFPTYNTRVMHLVRVHGDEERKYKCLECPKRYFHGSHLRTHVRNEHRKERNVHCDLCDYTFFSKAALVKHMVSHSSEKKFQCEFCQKMYPRKNSLNQHLKIHRNVKQHVCNVCGRAFTQKCTLNGHLKTHEKAKEPSVKDKLNV